MADRAERILERLELARGLGRCERGAYPGTAAHKRESDALAKLSEFDAAHPHAVTDYQGLPRRVRTEVGDLLTLRDRDAALLEIRAAL